MKRLAIISTHPIQYNAPLFKLLQERGNIDTRVFYTWGPSVLEKKFDPGFGKTIEWDIPLLDGYDHTFVENVSKDPGSHHFKGIDNPGLIDEIEAWKADAVLVYGWSFKSHLKLLRYFRNKIPVYFRGDSTLLSQTGFLKSFFRKIFLTWLYKHVDIAFYVGTHNKSYYQHFGLTSDQLVFAPHAIDNARFQQGRPENSILEKRREDLGISTAGIIFLYAGKLDGNKNVGLLAEAFTAANLPGTYLLIAGNGEEELNLKNRFQKNKQIRFLPFQNQQQMPGLYAMSNVFVLPSRSETWGLGINEAMAAGNAIIASSGCGCAVDLVKEGVNGYTFASDDVVSLTGKIRQLGSNPASVYKMGESSGEIIQSWNFENICAVIEKTLVKE